MFTCNSCGHIGDDFDVVSEDTVNDMLTSGELDHADDVEFWMGIVGETICPECQSTMVSEDE